MKKKEKKRQKTSENCFHMNPQDHPNWEGMLETISACWIKVLKSNTAIIFGDIVKYRQCLLTQKEEIMRARDKLLVGQKTLPTRTTTPKRGKESNSNYSDLH